MKATTNWASPNTGATNSSGFTGLPGGYRSSDGGYGGIGTLSYWWSSTEIDSDNVWSREMGYDHSVVSRYESYKKNGFSVRCVQD